MENKIIVNYDTHIKNMVDAFKLDEDMWNYIMSEVDNYRAEKKREKRLLQKKDYYNKNKTSICEKKKIKKYCDHCDKEVTTGYWSEHLKSLDHKSKVECLILDD
jgi:hypothetical protein